jgi:Carboxypeptidase regulatory-like domain/TonB-dependent Receptor Plug Domain
MKRVLSLCLVLLGTAPYLWAQASSGNIYGSITDASGAVLPGATITISGSVIGSRSTQSGSQGDFRFLNLDPGTYKLVVSMTGFATVNREIIVTTGQNVNLAFAMKVATVEESLTVTAETPVVDTKRVGTATTLTKEELAQVPQSRDPWAVLKTVPGVLVDRVNVAGNESGQQSGFVSKGSLPSDTQWNLDGVVITDVNSNGASSSYFDFDAFEEINVTTGGGDLKVQTGGIGINFVTKRGTNAFHGSLRGFLANHKLQSENLPDELKNDERFAESHNANHTDQIFDWGGELSGPIIKDKLWFWGAYGKNDIRIVRLSQTKDKTLLKNWNAKLNWQASSNDMLSLFWFNGAKVKIGRDPGVVTNEPNSFLWDQGNFYPEEGCGVPCGLHGLWKAEWNHTFSPNFFLNGKYAYYGWGYGFDAGATGGARDLNTGIDFGNDVAYGSYLFFTARKPWHIANLDGNYFVNAWGGQHEFKFGFSYRKHPARTTTTYTGNQTVAIDNGGGDSFVQIRRQRNVRFTEKVASGYIGDTFTKGRFTLNVGARYDHQNSFNEASTATGNPIFSDLLPPLVYDGSGATITWNDVSPRASMTLALDESRKTVMRASYARYAGQLFPNDVTTINPIGGYSTLLAYKWVDLNGDHFASRDEVLLNEGLLYYNNVDPANPTSTSSPNTIDPNYHASKDNEVVVGIDRELGGNFAVGGAYTWRKVTDVAGWFPRIGMTSADFIAHAPVSANGYTAQIFSPNDDLVAAHAGGRILTNRPDYSTGYNGAELTLTKRMSNKWFARAGFSYMDWHENLEGPNAIQNPTRTNKTGGQAGATQTSLGGPGVDGGQIAPKSGGSGKGDIFYNARWQFVFNALYQLPANFEIGTSIFGRQGYVFPVSLRISGTGELGQDGVLAVPTIDDQRYGSVWDADFRLANNIKLGGNASMQVTADLFNAFNSGTILARTRFATSSAFRVPTDVLAPRILRIGLRFNF